jgi:hypothetical protein
MANAHLFIGWNRPIPGMAKDAWAYVAGDGQKQLAAWKSEGWYESSELFALTPHGGDLNGFIILKGERAKLDELRRSDAFEKWSMSMGERFDNYGVVPGVTEAGLQAVMKRNPGI